MNVHRKFLTVFICLAFLPMLFIGASVYYIAKKSLEKEILGKLESIADLKKQKIEAYFGERRDNALTMQGSFAIKENLPVLDRFVDDRKSFAYVKAAARVAERFEAFQKVYGYVDVMLINPDGIVVYSDRATHGVIETGRPVHRWLEPAFQKGREGIAFSDTYSDPMHPDQLLMTLTAPIHDAGGRFIGEVAFEIDMGLIYGLIDDKTGLGDTGEIIIGKKTPDGAMLFNSVIDERGTVMPHDVKIGAGKGAPIVLATRGMSGSGRAVDYKGVDIIAAWRHIPSLNWGLVAKITVSEAFAPVIAMRNMVAVFFIAAVIVGGWVVYMLTGTVTRPIINLTRTARSISDGDLSARVAAASTDEIGELGRYFNKMTDELVEANRALRKRADELERLNRRLADDIKRREAAEDEVRRLNAGLEQTVTERTAELKAANKELESFSYSVSHDLRAPLRSITGFSELLRKKMQGAIDEKTNHYLDVISESASHMGRLIDDILSFSRMGRAEMMETDVDLAMVVGDVIKGLDDEALGREISWRLEGLPMVKGDPAMLRLAVENLVSNAVKFTKNRETPTITVAATERENEIICSVKDNGAGFDGKYADRLFNLFQRLHRADEFPGTGVGLANVRRIIERHGGRTWATGAPGKGATFYFALPKR